MNFRKTFGWNVQNTFSLPPKSVEHCRSAKEVLKAVVLLPVPPALFQEVLKLWDDWRDQKDSDFRDDPTPVEVDDVVWKYLNETS